MTPTTLWCGLRALGLISPAAGQARIESVPDGLLNNLVTTIPGFFFDEAIFNLDATANGSANITALGSGLTT